MTLGLLAGILGSLLGGMLADRYGKRDARWYLWMPAITSLMVLPFVTGFLLIDTLWGALLAYIPGVILGTTWLGAILAITQSMVKLRMRAVCSAILFLVFNLIGLGLGPQIVGFLNDLFAPSYGQEAVRYSLLLANLTTAWAALHFWLAARSVRSDLEARSRA